MRPPVPVGGLRPPQRRRWRRAGLRGESGPHRGGPPTRPPRQKRSEPSSTRPSLPASRESGSSATSPATRICPRHRLRDGRPRLRPGHVESHLQRGQPQVPHRAHPLRGGVQGHRSFLVCFSNSPCLGWGVAVNGCGAFASARVGFSGWVSRPPLWGWPTPAPWGRCSVRFALRAWRSRVSGQPARWLACPRPPGGFSSSVPDAVVPACSGFVTEAPSPNNNCCGVVPRVLPRPRRVEIGEPVLATPLRRVGRIDRYHRDAAPVGHGCEVVAELAGRHPRDGAAELLAAPAAAHCLPPCPAGVFEAEVLDSDRFAPVCLSGVEEFCDGGAALPVAASRRPAGVALDGPAMPQGVAVGGDGVAGEVVGVQIDGEDRARPGPQLGDGGQLDRIGRPRRVDVPAVLRRVETGLASRPPSAGRL